MVLSRRPAPRALTPRRAQPNFGGAVTVHSTVRTGTPIIALRPNSVTAEPAPGAAAVEAVAFTASEAAKAAAFCTAVMDAAPSIVTGDGDAAPVVAAPVDPAAASMNTGH